MAAMLSRRELLALPAAGAVRAAGIQRLDARDGRVLEAFQLEKGADPEPHGLCLHEGHLYYADAGLAGSRPSGGQYAGYICRFRIG